MPVGHPAKSARIEHTQFVPPTLTTDNAPLLCLRTAGITTEGCTNVNTCYIPASTISPPNLSNIGSNERMLFGGWDECPAEYEEGSAEIICEPSSDKRKCTAADAPLLAWIPERQVFLDETLHLKGRGNAGDLCYCGLPAPVFRCCDCFGMRMLCNQCVLHSHMSNPLHRIDMWSNSYFQRTSLKQIGLRMQLGHNPGEICYNPHPSTRDDFIVIDVHGIHEIALNFCGCASSQVRYKQLLHACWYPATTSEPHTAVTFCLLEHFHLLSFESKVSTYEFYHSLVRQNNNAGLLPIRDHYSAFMCIVHEWRHLMQIHRVGRGHDPAGVNATAAGELAVQCPACPHPGKNIPEGWEDAPLTVRWKYVLFIAIDANFRLKRKAVSSDNVNPQPQFWVGVFCQGGCIQIVPGRSSQCETRVQHVSTGVGAVDCARHDMKLANGVRDLQKGEKYVNMDYLVFSSLLAFTVTIINILYGIACQWHKKLWVQMEAMPSRLHIPHHSMTVRFFVPKFHLKAHIDESPERGWSNINRVASSTKEMGPGLRQDTLNDHFGDWNWKKIMVPNTPAARFMKLSSGKRNTGKQLAELENTIQPTLIIQWRKEVEAWEEDNSKSNPFESRYARITQAAVHLQLTELEAHKLQAGSNISLHTNISSSRTNHYRHGSARPTRLKMDIINVSLHPTDKQKSNMQMCITTLQCRLDAWAHIQELYMPVMSQLRHRASDTSTSNTVELKPKAFKLWLPLELQPMTVCDDRLAVHKWELRHAQALDALTELRSYLRLRSHMYIYKDRNVRGQAASTRTQAIIDGVELRKWVSIEKYRCACNALLALSRRLHKSGWEICLPPLLDLDVRPMGDMERQGTGTISWIWLDSHADNSSSENEQVQDCEFMRHSLYDANYKVIGVRVEWCKARARMNCWSEEVKLLLEEMQRVIVFLKWQAEWWSGRASSRALKPADEEGVVAYACRQAVLRLSLVASFQDLWRDIPVLASAAFNMPDDSEDVTPTIDEQPQL
ncbi:uncharacterized protein EDB91DRAFT_1249957 [Suillus paluster]|uniref:uncharacterized protein n=1 Tax=Suillus paluster TaxID=48578 RepID=UPI001B865945|nr:uncharacterized protein EDB91DRAFT_1249957 [Suillus paluster]KAG1736656.1 hypothetical protein EDB91DRAFT_1249957 [Suillus paluster]